MAYFYLVKWRIWGAAVFVALVTAFVAAGGQARPGPFLLLAASGSLAVAGSSFLNHYFDRDIDALIERTRGRPLPAGRIKTPWTVLVSGIALIGIGLGIAFLISWEVALFVGLGAFVYAVVYTLGLKRRTPWSIVIGGISGSSAALAGWSSIEGRISASPILIASLVFLWSNSHFWSFALAEREGYSRTGVPALSTVARDKLVALFISINALLFLGVVLALYGVKAFGWVYLLGAGLGALLFLGATIPLLWHPSPEAARRSYKLSGVFLLWVFSAMAIGSFIG